MKSSRALELYRYSRAAPLDRLYYKILAIMERWSHERTWKSAYVAHQRRPNLSIECMKKIREQHYGPNRHEHVRPLIYTQKHACKVRILTIDERMKHVGIPSPLRNVQAVDEDSDGGEEEIEGVSAASG